jgi:voltage-gated potassium channel
MPAGFGAEGASSPAHHGPDLRVYLPEESMNRPQPTQLDQRLAPAMFWLSLLFLCLTAGALHLIPGLRTGAEAEHVAAATTSPALVPSAEPLDPSVRRICALAGAVCGWGVLLLYPVFLFEAALHGRRGGGWRRHWWQCAFPPARIAARDHGTGAAVWLPRIGWANVDHPLRTRVEHGASIPMLVIALMVLPLLAAEHYLEPQIRSSAWLLFVVKASAGLIWMAFTFEFVLMLSLSERKWRYARQHWLDALIVSLPLIDVLPALRLGRLLRLGRISRLQQLARTLRVFRLRGTAMRLWRAILLLEVIDRVIGGSPEKRLAKLRDQLALKEQEVADLRGEIAVLESRLRDAGAAARDATAA